MFISKRCGCSQENTISSLSGSKLENLSTGLSAISSKSRLELLFLLKCKPHCVCDLTAHTKMSQSLVSHHLADLAKRGYVESKRKGKFTDFLLTEKGRETVAALELLIT